MGNVYNASAAFGVASAYVNAAISVILAVLCVSAGATFIRSPSGKGDVVQATITRASPGCGEGQDGPCDITVTYEYGGKTYTDDIQSLFHYETGDVIPVRVSAEHPNEAALDLPRKTMGWALLICAVLTFVLAHSLVSFVSDSKNLAAATGAFTFLQILLAA
ncbi:DUF3592 domain-containing protein [bacterium]|jgi:hypothetical protein|nr:DUF3592 domain-containing protein [bacterium]